MELRRTLKKISNQSKVIKEIVFFGYILYGVFNMIAYTIMHLLPVESKKVVFCNMKGIRYGDNPMYISEALHKKCLDYQIVWLVDENILTEIPDYAKAVTYSYWHVIRELATSRVWVDSNTKDLGTRKRKKQLFIQTWHGSYGIKKVALDRKRESSEIDRVLYPYNSRIADLMISNSARTSEIYRESYC